MIIDIKVQIDTDKDTDSELGELLLELLASIKQKLDAEEQKSD